MTRRVTVLAGLLDVVQLPLYLAFGQPLLAWINVLSVAMYVVAYIALRLRKNMLALVLIWVEVLGHVTLGTLVVGWEAGFHYYLLMFIPAIAISTRRWTLTLEMLLLFVMYLGLHYWVGSRELLHPMDPVGLSLLYAYNVAVTFSFAAYTARFYYWRVSRSELRLRQLAATDPLTGLANRRQMLLLANQMTAQARRTGSPVGVVLADIDHFKRVNDTYGHDAGDAVLGYVASLLASNCRESDLLARWGGEEFLLVLAASDARSSQVLAERVRQLVASSPVTVGDTQLPVTLSFGVTTVQPEETLEQAIARADRALYASKVAGRDRVSTLDADGASHKNMGLGAA